MRPPCRRLPARSTLWGKARTTQRRGAGLLLASVTGWRVGYPSVCTIKSTLDRRRHGTGHIAKRPGVLPQPLQRRPDLGGLAGQPGLNLCAKPIRIGAASHAPAKRSHVFQPTTPAQMLDVSQFYTAELLPSTA